MRWIVSSAYEQIKSTTNDVFNTFESDKKSPEGKSTIIIDSLTHLTNYLDRRPDMTAGQPNENTASEKNKKAPLTHSGRIPVPTPSATLMLMMSQTLIYRTHSYLLGHSPIPKE